MTRKDEREALRETLLARLDNGDTLLSSDRKWCAAKTALKREGVIVFDRKAWRWMGGSPSPSPSKSPQENDMDMHELAALLNGREYGWEMTRAEADAAKAAGLVVAYGMSDDIARFDGAVDDELGAYNGTTATVFSTGRALGQELPFDGGAQVVFSPEPDGNLSWRVIPNVPFAAFTINLEGDPFCEGAVFRLADCRPVASNRVLASMLEFHNETRGYPEWLAEAARAALASPPKGE